MHLDRWYNDDRHEKILRDNLGKESEIRNESGERKEKKKVYPQKRVKNFCWFLLQYLQISFIVSI